jgi:hypothetical protein
MKPNDGDFPNRRHLFTDNQRSDDVLRGANQPGIC